MYTKNMKILWSLSKNEMRLFLYFCSVMRYDNGCVELIPSIRKFLASKLGIEIKSLYNIITSLKKKGLIRESEHIYYYVDPEIAIKGKERE